MRDSLAFGCTFLFVWYIWLSDPALPDWWMTLWLGIFLGTLRSDLLAWVARHREDNP